MAPAKVYKEKDANKNVLKNKTLAVIGYGSQGHAHALNLKDSGYNVVVGLYPKSKSIEVAKKQGFKVLPTADAVKAADVIMVAVPDMRQRTYMKRTSLRILRRARRSYSSTDFRYTPASSRFRRA